MSRLFFLVLTSVMYLAAFDNKVYANEFAAVAAGCVPDSANIQGNDYLVTAGSVKHQTGNLRDIHLSCPISIVITKPTRIYLVASDNVGEVQHEKSFVDATLSNRDNSDDGLGNFCSANTGQASQDGTVHLIDVACPGLPATWDQTSAAWFLNITIHRSSGEFSAVFYGAGVY
jgi:hypothetical protein